MHVTVVSPEQAVFDGRADAVVAPAYDGQVGTCRVTLRSSRCSERVCCRCVRGVRRAVPRGGRIPPSGGGAVRIVADRVEPA